MELQSVATVGMITFNLAVVAYVMRGVPPSFIKHKRPWGLMQCRSNREVVMLSLDKMRSLASSAPMKEYEQKYYRNWQEIAIGYASFDCDNIT